MQLVLSDPELKDKTTWYVLGEPMDPAYLMEPSLTTDKLAELVVKARIDGVDLLGANKAKIASFTSIANQLFALIRLKPADYMTRIAGLMKTLQEDAEAFGARNLVAMVASNLAGVEAETATPEDLQKLSGHLRAEAMRLGLVLANIQSNIGNQYPKPEEEDDFGGDGGAGAAAGRGGPRAGGAGPAARGDDRRA